MRLAHFPPRDGFASKGEMARGAPLALLALALVLAVLAPCAGAGVMTGNDLEELAWRFRFAHGEAHASVLLEPLQRTLKAMQEHVAANLAQVTTPSPPVLARPRESMARPSSSVSARALASAALTPRRGRTPLRGMNCRG